MPRKLRTRIHDLTAESIARFHSHFLVLFIFASYSLAAQLPSWHAVRNCVELNSSADDFAPSIYNASKIYFNSERNGRSLFYTTSILPGDSFGAVQLVGQPFDAAYGGRSYITFLPTGGALLSAFRVSNGRSHLNIAGTDTLNGKWHAPKFLPEFLSDDFNAQTAISPDGALLAFSSDRAGGNGGTDIWFSYKLPSGAWGAPIHGGDLINSPGHEITPFFASNDTLYFASNGFGGEGGFEIFMATLYKGAWSPPIPLTELNTEYDESDFVQISSGTALFCSDRPGGKGGLDIFLAKKSEASAIAQSHQIEVLLAVQTPSITVRVDESKKKPILTFVIFQKNSAAFSAVSPLDSLYLRSLQTIAKRMKDKANATLVLTGWTDKSTSTETLELAARRAEIIRNILVNYGVSRERITTRAAELPAGSQFGDLMYRVDLNSSDVNIFQGINSDDFSGIYEPSMLECHIDARPREAVVAWACTSGNDTLNYGNDFPRNFKIKTSQICRNNADTVQLTLFVKNSFSDSFRNDISIPIVHITNSSTTHLTADAITASIDPSRVVETSESLISDRDDSQKDIVLISGIAQQTPDVVEHAFAALQQRFGASRVKLKRTENFRELLPQDLRKFSQNILLIGIE